MGDSDAQERHDPRVIRLKAGLLAVWALVSFVCCFFARDLQFSLGPWQFSYWMAAQGALIAFIAIVAVYAWAMQRLAPEDALSDEERRGG
jgi:putative solute:sodium symporter small subunit